MTQLTKTPACNMVFTKINDKLEQYLGVRIIKSKYEPKLKVQRFETPILVEFVGVSGVGKTTLFKELLKMINLIKTNLLLISIVILSSCNSSDFKVIDSEVRLLSDQEKQTIGFSKKYGQKVGTGSSQYLKLNEIKNSHKVVKTSFTIINNTKEVIEWGDYTIRINFKFKNKEYNYLKRYDIFENDKPWLSNEERVINNNQILALELQPDEYDIINIHTPESVKLELFFLAGNNLGYTNRQIIKNKKTKKRVFNSNKFHSTEFIDEKLSDREILSLGGKIFSKNITKIWNNKPNSTRDTEPTTDNYIIKGAFEFKTSQLELRNKNSDVALFMKKLKGAYNVNNSNLIFQPKGTDNFESDAIKDVTRVIVNYFSEPSNNYPKWNEDLTSLNNSTLDSMLKDDVIKSIQDINFNVKLLKWNSVRTGQVGKQHYLNYSYVTSLNDESTYSEAYHFFNKKEMVIIHFTTDNPCPKKWREEFDFIINSFNFINR